MSDLSGSWRFELEFLRGRAQHAAELTQEGEEVQGRYRSQYGEQEIRGRVRDREVELHMSVHHQACGASYAFRGQVQGDAMGGRVDLGEFWTGGWQARRA